MLRRKRVQDDHIKLLFHGTSLSRARSISRQGFLARKTLGNEIFFSSEIDIAATYAGLRGAEDSDEGVLIICIIDLHQYHNYTAESGNIYVFEHTEIDNGVIRRIVRITGDGNDLLEVKKYAQLPRTTLNFQSDISAIQYWINTGLFRPADTNDVLVRRIKQWLIRQANAGRSGVVPEDELLELVRRWENRQTHPEQRGGGLVFTKRLKKDLSEILPSLKRDKAIRDYDFNIDGLDDWIILYGIPLPPGFNYPDFNMKLPIPAQLYQPSGNDRGHFYSTIFIDEGLRRKTLTGYKPIARQIHGMYPEEKKKNWSYLCIIPRDVGPDADLRSVIAIAQRWIITNGE